MKETKTPAIKVPVVHAPDLLRDSHIYLAATDNRKVYVDDMFHRMPFYARRYLLLHEEGHIVSGHRYKRSFRQEREADAYAVRKMGKLPVYMSMLHIIKAFMNTDWTVSAEFMVRLADIGYKKASRMHITAPNGLRFDVDAIRQFL